jgi:hypothetical protein
MNLLKGEEESLSRRAIELALNGNVQMLQFSLSRILPPPPKDEAIKLEGMPACTDMSSAQVLSSYVLKRLAEGELSPSQANVVSGIVERHVRCLQVSDLEARLTLIEELLQQKG